MSSLSLTPTQLGTVTSMFFFGFAFMQLPTGVLLDRVGPRRTMSGMLIIAALGAALFALGRNTFELSAARVLIGIGCSAGLMGALVVIGRWFEPIRFTQLSSLLFTIGGIGVIIATTPLAALSEVVGWRTAFWLMSALTALMAVALFLMIKDEPSEGSTTARRDAAPKSLWQALLGLRQVLSNRDLLHISAIQFVTYATVLTIAGLWAGPYLNDVYGLSGVARGNALLAINVATLVGVMLYSYIERRLDSRKKTILVGASLSCAVLLVLALTPSPPLWLSLCLLVLFALVSGYVMISHAHARAVLPVELIGRGLTLQNLAVFLGVATLQYLSGVVVTVTATPDTSLAYRAVFLFLAVATLLGALCYSPVRDVRPSDEKRV